MNPNPGTTSRVYNDSNPQMSGPCEVAFRQILSFTCVEGSSHQEVSRSR